MISEGKNRIAGDPGCRYYQGMQAAMAKEDQATVKVREICGHIQEKCSSGGDLSLAALARVAGWSPFHLQRTFKAVMGVTPKEFVEGCRLATFKKTLRKGEPVTAAVYEAGFGSSSRVYERVDSRIGMTPLEYKAGGKNVAISYAVGKTSLGLLLVAATDRGLCFVQFGGSEADLLSDLKREYPLAEVARQKTSGRVLDSWMDALTRYLKGERVALNMPVDVQATAFQMKVWRYLQTIPAGETRTYGEVACAVGEPKASRAVGTACGANRVALVIPCHRVIRGDGEMGGYRWGVQRKKKLLEQERAG